MVRRNMEPLLGYSDFKYLDEPDRFVGMVGGIQLSVSCNPFASKQTDGELLGWAALVLAKQTGMIPKKSNVSIVVPF